MRRQACQDQPVDHRVLKQQPDKREEERGQADPEGDEGPMVAGQRVTLDSAGGGQGDDAPARHEVADGRQGHERCDHQFEHRPAG